MILNGMCNSSRKGAQSLLKSARRLRQTHAANTRSVTVIIKERKKARSKRCMHSFNTFVAYRLLIFITVTMLARICVMLRMHVTIMIEPHLRLAVLQSIQGCLSVAAAASYQAQRASSRKVIVLWFRVLVLVLGFSTHKGGSSRRASCSRSQAACSWEFGQ